MKTSSPSLSSPQSLVALLVGASPLDISPTHVGMSVGIRIV